VGEGGAWRGLGAALFNWRTAMEHPAAGFVLGVIIGLLIIILIRTF
jgi:hypothetical protein